MPTGITNTWLGGIRKSSRRGGKTANRNQESTISFACQAKAILLSSSLKNWFCIHHQHKRTHTNSIGYCLFTFLVFFVVVVAIVQWALNFGRMSSRRVVRHFFALSLAKQILDRQYN